MAAWCGWKIPAIPTEKCEICAPQSSTSPMAWRRTLPVKGAFSNYMENELGFNLVDGGTALGASHSPSPMYSSWTQIQPWTICQIPTVFINEQLTVEPGQRIGCSHGPTLLPAPELNQPKIKTQRSVSITSLIQSRQALP